MRIWLVHRTFKILTGRKLLIFQPEVLYLCVLQFIVVMVTNACYHNQAQGFNR